MSDDHLEALALAWAGRPADEVRPLAADGSARRYHRLRWGGRTVVAAVNADVRENRAFVVFSRHFRAAGLPVPEVLAESPGGEAYLLEDLGDTTLFAALGAARRAAGGTDEVPPEVSEAYGRVVDWLPRFQIAAARGLDFAVCHPRAAFDAQSMRWDGNYFKYHFLRLAGVPFDEQGLEDDLGSLIGFLETAPGSGECFLYRDFQSRNVLLRGGGEPWFIDYQGGRRGALPYDLASLLLDAKANLPFGFRDRLVARYLAAAAATAREHGASESVRRLLEPDVFGRYLAGFALIRLLQAMGAYGYRGFHERKTHFLASVPYALRNLERLLGEWKVPVELPVLREVLARLTRMTRLREIAPVTVPLTVGVRSFSYRRGVPVDEGGHGGGYVFDCRALPNPGREERFAAETGLDAAVVRWLEAQPEVAEYLVHVRGLLHGTVQSYHRRNFTRLSVAFGCTGGQHRSVYCAEQVAAWLRAQPHVTVEVEHREAAAWPARA